MSSESREPEQIGSRVVRNSTTWHFDHQDGGEGHLGTIVEVLPDNQCLVLWDHGVTANYGHNHVRIFDNSPAGTIQTDVTCDECGQSPIHGIRWQCCECDNYDLCSKCYHGDKHELMHRFSRYSRSSSRPERVAPRGNSSKITAIGIFESAKVIRAKDWEDGDHDGGQGKTGTVIDMPSWGGDQSKGTTVAWANEQDRTYHVGKGGKVHLRATVPTKGPKYYENHLPIFERGSAEDTVITGLTPLHKAALDSDEPAIIAALVTAGINLNEQNSRKQTALHIAAIMDHARVAKKLLDLGCDPDVKDNQGESAIFDAIRKNSKKVLSLLLEAMVDISMKNQDGFSPIHIAAMVENVEIMTIFLEKMPEPEMVNMKSTQGHTALHIAINKNNISIAKLLIQTGNADVNAINDSLRTPLHDAATRNHFEIVELLIEKGCDINVVDKDGDSPLHDTVCQHTLRCLENNSHTSLEKILFALNRESNPKLLLEKIAGLLVSKGADPKLKNKKNQTVIDLCSDKRLLYILENPSMGIVELVSSSSKPVNPSETSSKSVSDVQTPSENRLICPVCWHYQKNFVFQCGHGVCEHCVNHLSQCPICRVDIIIRIQTF